MASLSWKPLSLLGGILVIAIGLQAGGIKIMINLSQPDELATGISNGDHAKPLARPSKPETAVTDPPYLAGLNGKLKPEPEPKPEPSSPAHAPDSESHSSTPTPAAEPAPPPTQASMPMSRIPPPIELESGTSAEKPTVVPHGMPPAASVEAAALVSRIPPPIELEAPVSTLLEPDWLEARDPGHYTVQLYSGRDLDRLREIAASDSIAADGPKAYFTTSSRSGPWYSLVIGDYPDFTAAQKTATQIAADSGSIKPWIRRFSEIQARMR